MEDDRNFDHIPLQIPPHRHFQHFDVAHHDAADAFEHDDTLPAPRSDAMIGRRFARRVERACCTCATCFPLFFVYTLTSWAVYVLVRLGADTRTSTVAAAGSWVGPWCSVVAVVLYVLLLWSYTTAVFTPPGSTTNDQGYSTVPAALPLNSNTSPSTLLTVKSNGEMRFCKKCQARKPDRAHHCSTCRRCVLKMDHHCPWLATCIGLRNGKAFLLFLIYTSLFAQYAFLVSGAWVWAELSADSTYAAYGDSLMPVQYIMLCVIGGIIGLVVGLFTAWHIMLACRGQTTIECLETTRYRSPLRAQAVHLVGEGHMGREGNGLRDEEQGLVSDGNDYDDHEEHHDGTRGSFNGSTLNGSSTSSAYGGNGGRPNYNDLERYRAHKRHQEYMDEEESKKLPHAFDLGLRRNLRHMFGPSPWLWALPIMNTTGDGWTWEPSPKWLAARDRNQREREAQRERERAAGWGISDDEFESPTPSPPVRITTTQPTPPRPHPNPQPPSRNRTGAPSRYGNANGTRRTPPGMVISSKADRVLGRQQPMSRADGSGSPQGQGMNMQKLNSSGRAVHYLDKELNDLDDDDDDDDDELDNTSEEEPATGIAPATSAPPSARPPTVLRQPSSSSTQRSLSPLRSRWMPDPASGLLRKGGASTPPTPGTADSTASPTLAGAADGKSDIDDDVD